MNVTDITAIFLITTGTALAFEAARMLAARLRGKKKKALVRRSLETAKTTPLAGPVALRRGDIVLERFELERLVSDSGMSCEAWAARDPSLQLRVLLKVARPWVAAHPEMRYRFLREGAANNLVEHHAIPRVLQRGELADRRPVLAVQHVEGITLWDFIAQQPDGKVGVRNTLEILRDIADVLAFVHEAGIVHRDLTPANIMVRKVGGISLIDFGIARIEDLPRRTRAGAVFGTPGFMSPEQARGECVDARADVWSLGAIGYTLLVGRPPFDAPTVGEVIAATVAGPPPSISNMGHVPRGVAVIIDRALQNKSSRYQTAAEMRDAVLLALVRREYAA